MGVSESAWRINTRLLEEHIFPFFSNENNKINMQAGGENIVRPGG